MVIYAHLGILQNLSRQRVGIVGIDFRMNSCIPYGIMCPVLIQKKQLRSPKLRFLNINKHNDMHIRAISSQVGNCGVMGLCHANVVISQNHLFNYSQVNADICMCVVCIGICVINLFFYPPVAN